VTEQHQSLVLVSFLVQTVNTDTIS